MRDLGTLGGGTSQGLAINTSGKVAGISTTGALVNQQAVVHAFVTVDSTMVDLGTLGGTNSYANAINAGGQVTGASDTANGGGNGFLYDNGKMINLNSLLSSNQASLYTITAGVGINDNGQIVADGFVDSTNLEEVFLLNPVNAVPLPAAGWRMLSGLGGLGALAGKRRIAKICSVDFL
jgi:probable HAF family extracellular repeat protein